MLAILLLAAALPLAVMASTGSAAAPDPALSNDLLAMGDAGNNRVRIIDVDAQAVVNDITGPDVLSNHGTLWDGRYIWTANAGMSSPGTIKVVKLDTATLDQSAAWSVYNQGAGGLCGIEFNQNVQGSNLWVLDMGAGAGSGGALEVDPDSGFTGVEFDTGSGADNRATCGIGWNSAGTIAVASLMNAKKTNEMSWPSGTLTGRGASHGVTIHILDVAKTAGYAYVSAGASTGVSSAVDVVDLATMTTVGSVALSGYNPHSVSIAHNEGFAYSHSRAVSGGQPASILVFDIGGGSAGGTKTAPVLIGAFANGGGAGSCGVDVAVKSDYCGSLSLNVSTAMSYYASASDYESGIVSTDLDISNGGTVNAIDVQLTGYSADNGVTAATSVPVDVGDIPAGSSATVTVKFNVPAGVSSFNITYNLSGDDLCGSASTPSGAKITTVPATKDYFFTWYDNNKAWGMNGDWVTINNVDTTAAKAGIYVDGVLKQSYDSIAAGSSVQWQSPTTITDGPVEVVSYNGQKLNTTQRVVYKNSFNEIRGVEKGDMESEYHFTWYDNNKSWGMNGNWIVVTNAGDSAADVDITIGGNAVATGLAIPAGGQTTWQSPTTLTDGPVNVIDNNSQPLLVSQRVIYKDSFNEAPGVPNSKLGSEAWLSWYDNNKAWGMNGNWVCIYNDGASAASVEIKVNGDLKDTLAIPAGGHTEWKSPVTLTDGAVQVKDTNGQPLLVSNRTIYMDSFDEVAAMCNTDAGDNADFNWYDNNKAWGMNGDWIVVTNLGAQTTNIDIKVGGVSRKTQALAAGARYAWKSSTTLTGGPVEVTSDNAQPLLVSQRILYKNSYEQPQLQLQAAAASPG